MLPIFLTAFPYVITEDSSVSNDKLLETHPDIRLTLLSGIICFSKLFSGPWSTLLPSLNRQGEISAQLS